MKSKLVYTLLAGTFLTSSAVAETIEVTADYLNSLTSPNIAWDESNKSDYSSVLIGGNEFFFGYTGDEDKAAIGYYYEGSGQVVSEAFYNYSNIGDLTADFLENHLFSLNGSALGAAIYNDYGNINDITGNFVGNYAEGSYAYGGALYNYMGVIDDINGSFIGNYVHGNNDAYGGAIYNYGISNIDDITGSFIGNSAVASNAYGGAVFNDYNGLIGVITGDFINNYVQGGDTYGGAIYNRSYMGDINGNFENNYAKGDYAYGGALYNEYGNIDDITGNFSYNSAYGYDGGYGGAIYNNSNTDNITGDFTGNYAEGENASGGAVYNNGEIPLIAGGFYDNAVHGDYANGGAIYNSNYLGDLKGDFSNNYAQSESESIGGAIFNAGGNINDIIGNFSGNYSLSNNGFAGGGALFNNMGVIDDIEGSFTGNYAQGSSAGGGAIYNHGINIDDVTGDFSNNYAQGENEARGGAIYSNSLLGDLNGDFSGNYASAIGVFGGAIYNSNYLGDINGNFDGNYAIGEYALGGAIYNVDYGNIDDITGNFLGNYVKGEGDYAAGGAILNDYGVIDDITGDFIGNYAEGFRADGGAISNGGEIGAINGSFINNYVKVIGEDEIGYGGAITTYNRDLTFKTEGTNNRFSGNYVENADGSKVNNAIFVYNDYENGAVSLNFEVENNGSITFDDEIDGGYVNYTNDGPTIVRDGYGYNINIYGEVCPQCVVNSVIFNSEVKNVYDLTLDTTQMVLGKDAHIQIVNDYIATGETNPYLRLDVDAVNSKTGQLEIGGQVVGTTQVIANIVNYKDVRGEESIVFATAENDTTGGEESFKIFRTIGSPYKWYVDYDESAKTWGLAMGEDANDYEEDCDVEEDDDDNNNSNPSKPVRLEIEPEVIAMEALPSAGLAQTNGMIYNIMRKVGNSYIYCPGCGFYDPNWDGEPFHNVWVDTTYNGLTIEAPVEIDAKVWGIEAGADIQKDLNNKLGIFVSYRQGNYEMDGKGDKYFSKLGSELDIDSYLAGLYYRYDNNNWYAFATLYGGMQNAEIQTDDGVSTDTDGIEFGGSAEVGYNYALNKTVFVTPTLGVFYSQINYDDASDNYGKTVEYDDLRQVELEAGLKLSKAVYTDNGTASVYVKPSVVQTLVDGDEINITEIGKVDTIEDKTLGRIEIGGSYGFNDNWSAYGWANYTFGSDYEATSLGAGVNYAW